MSGLGSITERVYSCVEPKSSSTSCIFKHFTNFWGKWYINCVYHNLPSSQFNGKCNLRYSFVFDVMQHIMVAIHQRFRTNCRSHLQELRSPRRPLKIGQISCSTTSVTKYRNALRNIPEERRSHLHHSRSLKSRKSIWYINFRNLSPTLVFSAFLYYSIYFLSYCLSFPTVVLSTVSQQFRYASRKHVVIEERQWTSSSTSGIISMRPLCTYTNTQAFRRLEDVEVCTCLIQFSVGTVPGY